MGQKVHPNGIRLGITKPFNSTWFANTKEFADNLHGDFQVRQYLTKELKAASLSRIVIERPAKSIRVTIHTARPGVVIGKKGEGEKVLLTLLLEKSNFMMAFLRNQNDAQSVVDCFDRIEKTLGTAKFATMFYITLGDNGSEFSKADALEGSHRAFKRTHLFYCDARASQQKGKLEKNHEYIRKYFPQGTSFNCLTQDDVDLMMNHINSVKRESLGNKSPFQCLSRSETISIKKLGYNEIHPNDVILNPSLFKKK